MSAIFGVIGAVLPAELQAMGERMSHRGSVVTCEETAPGVHLGRVDRKPRRVCVRNEFSVVVDLSSASDVESAGSDVVDALVEHGVPGLEKLRFAFALAAWDDRTKTLLLARDFVGQKPLYWCALPGGGAAFATEFKALLALDSVPAEADVDALQFMQCYKRTPPGRTLLRDVYPCLPGSLTVIGIDGAVRSQDNMRSLQVGVEPVSEIAARDELAHRVVESIRESVAGRTRIGIALSGGIDSMSVAFACRSCAPDAELVGFSAGNGPDDPDISTAAVVMERLGGRHEAVVVSADPLITLLPEAVWYFESPVGRTETVQMLELGRRAHRLGFDWIMSGFAADILFAGMPKHKLLWLSQLLPPIRKDLYEFYTLTQSGRLPDRPLAKLMDWLVYRGAVPPVPRIRDARFRPEIPVFPKAGPEFLNHVLVEDVNRYIARSLVRMERPLQASGIDFVSPFFDREVMEYAFTLPSRLKIRRGREKYILRRAMSTLVSPDLLNRRKGISRIRQDRLFAETLGQLASRYLSIERVQKRGWFDIDEIRRIQHSLRRKGYHTEAAMRLWTAIVTEIWGEIYLDRRGRRPTS